MEQMDPQAPDPNYAGSLSEAERRGQRNAPTNRLLYVLTTGLVAAVIGGLFYVSAERQRSSALEASNRNMAASLAQVQTELLAANEKMSDLLARTTPAEPPAPAPVQSHAARTHPSRERRVGRNDAGLGRLQSQLSEQQRQIASTRADLDQTKSDLSQTRDSLQNNINSTKDELNGSIARTHDEVVALQKRGERNYYEFTLDKAKQFSRVGPLGLELRKADTKHERFDMKMLVDDNELQKKNVNLYETVWISLSDRPQPLELVVNKITKNHIEGYVSEPKYKRSELQSSAAVNPASAPANPGLATRQ